MSFTTRITLFCDGSNCRAALPFKEQLTVANARRAARQKGWFCDDKIELCTDCAKAKGKAHKRP